MAEPEVTELAPQVLNATEQILADFSAAIEMGGSHESARTYTRHMKRFLAFSKDHGWIPEPGDLTHLPADALQKFYSELQLTSGTCNVCTSSAKAFQRWASGSGIPITALIFPAAVKVKSKKPRRSRAAVPPPEDSPSTPDANWWPSMSTVPAAVTAPIVPAPIPNGTERTGSAPNGSAPAGVPSPHDALVALIAPEEEVQEEAPAPAPRTPPPQNLPPRAPFVGRQMTPPRPMTKHATQNRNPIAAMMPATGKLRISRVSDGSGSQPAGKAQLIGEYNATEVTRYADPVSFVHGAIRPAYGPLPGMPDVVYLVEQLNEYGQVVGAPLEVAVAAPLAGAAGPGVGAYGTVPLPGQQSREAILTDRIMDMIAKKEAENEKKYQEMISQMTSATGKGADPTMMFMLMNQMRPQPIDVEAVIRAAKSTLGERTAPVLAAPVLTAPNYPSRGRSAFGGLDLAEDDSNKNLTDLLKSVVERAFEQKNIPPPPAAPVVDPMMQMMTMMKLFKEMSGDSESQRLREELRDLKNQMASGKNTDFTSRLNEMMALKRFTEEMSGNDDPSLLETIFGNMPDIGEGVSKIISSLGKIQAPSIEVLKQKAAAAKAPPTAPPAAAAPHEVPQTVVSAILALRDAKPEEEQLILNALFSVISGLSSADEFWQDKAQQLVDAIKQVRNKSEIRQLISTTFMLLGARNILTEELVEKTSAVLHKYYSGLYQQLFGSERHLEDEGAAGQPGVPAPGVPAPSVTSPVVTAPVVPAPSTAAPPVTAEDDEDESDEDEDEDEDEDFEDDEESSDSEDSSSDEDA